MNRLTALEANTTLYARYVEEQTAGIRDVLRRMGEDVGRLEGMRRAREQVWRRERGEMEKMERERRRVEGEVGELVRRVEVLVDEVCLSLYIFLPLSTLVRWSNVGCGNRSSSRNGWA